MHTESRIKTAMSLAKHIVIFLISLVVQNEGARILAVFPTPSISHQVVFRPLVLELVKLGHEVVMLTTDPIFEKGRAPTNLTEVDVHDMSYKLWTELFLQTTVTQGTKDDLTEQVAVIFKLMETIVEQQMLTDEMQTLLKDKSQEFDLLLLEAFAAPLLGLTTVYNVPVIQISSFGALTADFRTVGAPINPLVYPTSVQQRVFGWTFWEKIAEIYEHFKKEKMFATFEKSGSDLIKRLFGQDALSLPELRKRVDMLFLNVRPLWEFNRPVPPNVIYMGGLHQKSEKKLPQDLKTYLDSSKHGVIYLSFGTNVEPALLPPEKIQALINAFGKLPYDVLWKWNKDDLPGRTKNIKISKWLPQSDLLKHPKIKLFITQGGLQSTDEAITAGVPLLGIPMLGDQWFNVDQYVLNKIGLRVDMETVTEEKIVTAIQTITKDESYRENIVRLCTLMRDEPQTPLERATWWTEYVLRHGGAKHLRSPAANMPWTEYYEIKLISLLILILGSAIAFIIFAVCYLHSFFNKHHKFSTKLKNN